MVKEHSKLFIATLVFLSAFALYLFSSAPALAPYRDMGEMVSVSHSLGVAHPPGYPAYTLLGKISTLLPFANQSYRVNLLAVAGGALAASLIFLFLLECGMSLGVSLLSVLLWLGSPGVWTVATVTEMYSLNLAAAFALVWAASRAGFEGSGPRFLFLLAFLSGILAGIRLDLSLLFPSFALLAVYESRNQRRELLRAVLPAILFFAAGASVYLFLLVRSRQDPILNWLAPDTFERLWNSLTRKSHGGTLDLLSVNYKPGELFFTNMELYFKDVLLQFKWFGVIFIPFGLHALWKTRMKIFLLTFAAWIFAGPFFIYKANMPPNTHAFAILEAHFLLPNVFVFLWIAFGIHAVLSRWVETKGFGVRAAVFFLSALLCFSGIHSGWQKSGKRGHLFGYDYAKNVFRSLPKDSILVMKKDVQLFLFWAMQIAEGARPDIAVVARGLAASPWYHRMMGAAGVSAALGPLGTEKDFLNFLTANPGKKIYVGWDEDVPPSTAYVQIPNGLVRNIALKSETGPAEAPDFLSDLTVYRGNTHSSKQKDFFSSDLVDDYSKGRFARGVDFYQSPSGKKRAVAEWDLSLALNDEKPETYYRRAFSYYEDGNLDLAERDFKRAERQYEKTYRMTRDFHSLPDVVESVVREWTECLMNLGVVLEKEGKREESERVYLKALELRPDFAGIHYNIAVLYWGKDWNKVIVHLEAALRADPGNQAMRAYLMKAMESARRPQ